MTQEGAITMRQELEHLTRVERPNIIKSISEARAFGDLKENAEYHSAKDRQGFIEAKIKDLENRLGDIQIIDISELKNDGKVVFGSTVTILNLESEQKKSYKIVGEYETDLSQNKIALNTPIAKALVSQYVGNIVTIKTPGGVDDFEILSVSYK